MLKAALNMLLPPFFFALVFCTPMVQSYFETKNAPEYDVVCWDSSGNNIFITRADAGTLRVKDGVYFFDSNGTKRVLQGDCLLVEVD